MYFKKINDKTYDYIKNEMSQKMKRTTERCNLTQAEEDLLTEVNSRTLYGVYILCKENGIKFDYKEKLKLFDFYDFGYKENPNLKNICAENHRSGFSMEDANNGLVTKNSDEILLTHPNNISEKEVRDSFLNDEHLSQVLVHENLHFLDGFVKDEEFYTTRFKHAFLDGKSTNLIVEIMTEDISCMIMDRFFDENYSKKESKDFIIRAKEMQNGELNDVLYIKPTVGTGYSPISANVEVLKLNGLNSYLKSYFNLTNDIYDQFTDYKTQDYSLVDNLEGVMVKTFKSLEMGKNNLDEQFSFSENLKNSYMSQNEIVINMFKSRINKREENAMVEFEKILLSKKEILTNSDIEQKKDEFIQFSRKNCFNDYLSQSIKLIDSSFIIRDKEIDIRPMEKLMSELDYDLYKDNFEINNEKDKQNLINAFSEIRQYKRDNPNKKIDFEDFKKLCEEKDIKPIFKEEDNEKVLVEPQLQKLYEYQKQREKDIEISLN